MRALLIAAIFAAVPVARADDASDLEDRIAAIESQLATLRAQIPAKPNYKTVRTKPVRPSLTQRGVAQVFNWRNPFFGALGVPIFTYPGGGGSAGGGGSGVALGDTPTWTGAHTFSADATFNGGPGAIRFVTASPSLYFPNGGTLAVSDGTTDLFLFTDSGSVGVFDTDYLDTDFVRPRTASGIITFETHGGLLVDGAADAVQLRVQGHSTQTTLPFVVENSAGTDQFTVSNSGTLTALGNGFFTGYVSVGGSSNDRISAGSGVMEAYGGGSARFRLEGVAVNATSVDGQLGIAHLANGGGATTGAVAGTGCGTSSAPTQAGGDISGKLGATCGTAGTTANPIVTVTFAEAYNSAPSCSLDPDNAATAAVMVSAQVYPVTTTTTLAAQCGGGTCPTGTLSWTYTCVQ